MHSRVREGEGLGTRLMLNCCSSVTCSAPVQTDIKDKYGKTALDYARERGYTDIVELISDYKPLPRGELLITVSCSYR